VDTTVLEEYVAFIFRVAHFNPEDDRIAHP
jgi:hypothetical protein